MGITSKIVLWNFIAILFVSVASFLINFQHGGEVVMLFILFQILVNLICSIYNYYTGNKEVGKSYFLVALLMTIVGPSTCFGTFMIFN
jgi:hypothetical protein